MAVRREIVVPVVLFIVLASCSVLLLQPVRAQKPADLHCAADDLVYTRINDIPSTAPPGSPTATVALDSFLLFNYPRLDRAGFRTLVSGHEEMEVVHTAADGTVDMIVHLSGERGWYVTYIRACNSTLSDATGSVMEAADHVVDGTSL
ncbi:MAG TPA: hypothetical protein VNC78_02140 [Actinomycetota bacterium]|nr:hypothetical protein [Actinomycetota bacterium]